LIIAFSLREHKYASYMPISVELNDQYQLSQLVTQKYQPLGNIRLPSVPDTKIIIDEIIEIRKNAFELIRIIKKNRIQDTFFVTDITYFGENLSFVEGNGPFAPPLVVISSNRSRWIRQRYDAGVNKKCKDVNDKSALTEGAVPFYCPFRLGKEGRRRNVYIFVHSSEYKLYQDNLGGTGMKVIAWQIGLRGSGVGFGATRYAAVEFFKKVCRERKEFSGKIWLMDDNVTYINGFPGFSALEGVMDHEKLAGLGFRGGSGVRSDTFFKNMPDKNKGKDKSKDEGKSDSDETGPALTGASLLQQAVLWNIRYMEEYKTNFSPYFVSSAEDSSFTQFLGKELCKAYEGFTVEKASIDDKLLDATKDKDNRGFRETELDILKKELYTLLCPTDNKEDPQNIIIDLMTDNKGKPTTLNAALEKVLEKLHARNKKDETIELIYSKAVEQLIIKAMDAGVQLPQEVFSFATPIIKFLEPIKI